MPDFMFAFHGGKMPETEEEGRQAMAAWGAWYGSLGQAVKNPGNPVGKSSTVSASGVTQDGGANPISGYAIVTAADQAAAEQMAASCPILDGGGSVEVAEVIVLDMD